MITNYINIIINLIFGIKFLILSSVSFLLGTTIVEGFMLFFQEQSGSVFSISNWLPALLGGVGGLIVLVLGQVSSHVLNLRAERDKDQRKKQEENNLQHITFTDKIAELQQERDEKFLEELKNFHEDKVEYKNSQIKDLKISEYAARQREHLAINEVNRLWAHIHICHAKMKMSNIEFPELIFKNNEEIMEALEDKIIRFAQVLDKEGTKND